MKSNWYGIAIFRIDNCLWYPRFHSGPTSRHREILEVITVEGACFDFWPRQRKYLIKTNLWTINEFPPKDKINPESSPKVRKLVPKNINKVWVAAKGWKNYSEGMKSDPGHQQSVKQLIPKRQNQPCLATEGVKLSPKRQKLMQNRQRNMKKLNPKD